MTTVLSPPPSDSPTPSNYYTLFTWPAALCFSLLFAGTFIWLLLSSNLFADREITRLAQNGVITIEQPIKLSHAIIDYLNDDTSGLIQQHRLGNPERAHLLSVKRLLVRLKQGLPILLISGVMLLLVATRKGAARQTVNRVVLRTALLCFTLILLSSVLLAFKGFAWSFIQLHYLFFAQPDWVFPLDSILTSLYPPQLFLRGMLTWLAMMIVTLLTLLLVAYRFTSSRTTLQ